MSSSKLFDLLDLKKPVIADGAMGTMLHSRGEGFTKCFDELNISNPELVAGIHRDYIASGAQIIKTNTFGANKYKLARYGLEAKVVEINQAGVELVRRAILDSPRPVLIAGDLGPLGVRLAPFGRVQPEQAYQAFLEQVQVLAGAGVDLFLIETQNDIYEAREAIRAARSASPDLPVIASMTFTRDDRTLMGDAPARVVRGLSEAGADLVGVNCSGGPNQILRILSQMKQAAPEVLFSVMPNAGWPEEMGGRVMYPAGPGYFGEYAVSFWQAGANIIGGCCGTSPAHIAAMVDALEHAPAQPESPLSPAVPAEPGIAPSPTEQPTQLSQRLAGHKFTVAVEMDPPRGLVTHKLLAGASLLAEAGADVINVADSPMARMRMSPWAVCSLIQRKIDIETVLHFPTRGRNLLRVQGDLLAAHALGVRNVFVVMGDPTAIGDYPGAMDKFDLVPSGLIKLIKQNFNAGVDHAGSDIGLPTTFFVGCALNLASPNLDEEIRNLRRKLAAGADFILTQPVYRPETVARFLGRYEAEFGPLPVPMLAGILPLYNERHAAFLQHEVPGVFIPDEARARLAEAGENGPRTGVKIAVELIQQIRPSISGVYLMPAFNRFDLVADIIDAISIPATIRP